MSRSSRHAFPNTPASQREPSAQYAPPTLPRHDSLMNSTIGIEQHRHSVCEREDTAGHHTCSRLTTSYPRLRKNYVKYLNKYVYGMHSGDCGRLGTLKGWLWRRRTGVGEICASGPAS